MKLKLASILLAVSATGLNAGVLSITNQVSGVAGDTAIFFANDTIATSGIATGGYFDVGYDVNTGLTLATTSGDFSSFIGAFNILTSDVLGAGGGSGANGFYFASFDYGAPVLNPPVGASLYSILGNGVDLASSSEFAVLMSADTVALDSPLPDDNNITLPTNTTVLLGTVATGMVDFGAGLVSTPTLSLVSAAPVPEPSALLLSAFGALALLRRKR